MRGSRLPPQVAAMSAISLPPPCRPWDRSDLMRRLASFKAMTWFAKPKVHPSRICHPGSHPFCCLVDWGRSGALAPHFEKMLSYLIWLACCVASDGYDLNVYD